MYTAALLSSALALLASAKVVHVKRQYEPTYDPQGLISSIPTNTKSAIASTGTPATGFQQSSVASLWQQVVSILPVDNGSYTSVQAVNDSYTVPPTQLLPSSLQDHSDPASKFPPGFLFGVATADQQYEGAVKSDGRSPSVWDYLCHTLPAQCNNYTSDVTDEGRYLYKQDIARMKAIGINSYSFSISWSRVLPFAAAGSPNSSDAIAYYSDIVDECVKHNITPVVTLFHWSLPLQLLFEYGGFLNETTAIVDDFAYYAQTMFAAFGDRVTTWITINEPQVYCGQNNGEPYVANHGANGVNTTTATWRCSYNTIRAHAAAVQVYRNMSAQGQIKKGEISYKNNANRPIPLTNSTADEDTALRALDFQIGIYAEPIFLTGNYPASVRSTIPESVMPNFTTAEQQAIKGSADFFAYDGYATGVAAAPAGGIAACTANISDPAWPICNSGPSPARTSSGFALGTPATPESAWLQNTAQYIRFQIKSLVQKYNISKFYYTEWGFSSAYEYLWISVYPTDALYDADRAAYYQDYLSAFLESIIEDKMPLAGIWAWSIVDNFEWNNGLNTRFGMTQVNFDTDERTYKLSALVYRDFIANHSSSA